MHRETIRRSKCTTSEAVHKYPKTLNKFDPPSHVYNIPPHIPPREVPVSDARWITVFNAQKRGTSRDYLPIPSNIQLNVACTVVSVPRTAILLQFDVIMLYVMPNMMPSNEAIKIPQMGVFTKAYAKYRIAFSTSTNDIRLSMFIFLDSHPAKLWNIHE